MNALGQVFSAEMFKYVFINYASNLARLRSNKETAIMSCLKRMQANIILVARGLRGNLVWVTKRVFYLYDYNSLLSPYHYPALVCIGLHCGSYATIVPHSAE